MKRMSIVTIYVFGLLIGTPIAMYLANLIGISLSAGGAEHTHPIAYVLTWSVASVTSGIFTMLMWNGED